jgi:hypothetical protein
LSEPPMGVLKESAIFPKTAVLVAARLVI